MISSLKKIGILVVAVVVLKFAATRIAESSPYFDRVVRDGLDPSQMFYTESKEALKAEKEIRRRVSP